MKSVFLMQIYQWIKHRLQFMTLIALGYTMVYGIAKLINFAHGDVIMVGAYISFISMKFGLPWWLAVIISTSHVLF